MELSTKVSKKGIGNQRKKHDYPENQLEYSEESWRLAITDTSVKDHQR